MLFELLTSLMYTQTYFTFGMHFFCSRADAKKGQEKSQWNSLLAKVDFTVNTWEVGEALPKLLQLIQFRCVVTLVMPG